MLAYDVPTQVEKNAQSWCDQKDEWRSAWLKFVYMNYIYIQLETSNFFPSPKALETLETLWFKFKDFSQEAWYLWVLELHENPRWIGEHPNGAVPDVGVG